MSEERLKHAAKEALLGIAAICEHLGARVGEQATGHELEGTYNRALHYIALLTEQPEPVAFCELCERPLLLNGKCPSLVCNPVEPAAPQEVEPEDCHNQRHTINNYRGTPCPFCQRDQYKEKLDTLVGLVREYREAIGDVLERCTPKTYSAEIRTCRAMFAYAEEVGGSE